MTWHKENKYLEAEKSTMAPFGILDILDVLWALLALMAFYRPCELKGTQAWNFFFTFFAETETLWSQGPVTQDFWKSYSIRLRYSTFKHFRACSACDEISSAYAQCAIKFVPRMLSMDCTCKNCSNFTTGWACAEIRSSYAQHAMKSVPRMLSMR
jgi:hypothetical protein